MNRNFVIFCALICVLSLAGCAGMSDTQRRTGTGALIGGAAAGIVSGEWEWAAAGAAAGAAGGYLYDKSKRNEQDAYERGLREGRATQPR
jgi:hypothetical protein